METSKRRRVGRPAQHGHGGSKRVSLWPLGWYQLLRFGLFALLAAVLFAAALLVLLVLGYQVDGDVVRTALIGTVLAAAPASTLMSYFVLRRPRERAVAAVTARATRWTDSPAPNPSRQSRRGHGSKR